MRRQNILLKPTDTELLEEADCTHKRPGVGKGRAVDLETCDSLWWTGTGRAPRALLPWQGRDQASRGGASSPLGTCPFGSLPEAFIQLRSQWLITKIRIIKFGSRNRLSNCSTLLFFQYPRPLQRNKNISQSPNKSELLFFLLQMLRPEEWLQIEISKISEKYIIYLYISVCLLFKFHIPLKVVIQSVAAEGGSSAGPGGSVVLPWVFEFPVDQAGSGKGPRLPDSLYTGRQQTPEPVAPVEHSSSL